MTLTPGVLSSGRASARVRNKENVAFADGGGGKRRLSWRERGGGVAPGAAVAVAGLPWERLRPSRPECLPASSVHLPQDLRRDLQPRNVDRRATGSGLGLLGSDLAFPHP